MVSRHDPRGEEIHEAAPSVTLEISAEFLARAKKITTYSAGVRVPPKEEYYGDQNELDLGRIRDPCTVDSGRILLGYSRKLAIGSSCKEFSRSPAATRSDSARAKKLTTD